MLSSLSLLNSAAAGILSGALGGEDIDFGAAGVLYDIRAWLSVVVVTGLFAVVVLLFLPASVDYFRSEQAWARPIVPESDPA